MNESWTVMVWNMHEQMIWWFHSQRYTSDCSVYNPTITLTSTSCIWITSWRKSSHLYIFFFLRFVDRASLYILVNEVYSVQFILSTFINLYMFQVTMCPSSGETTVFMWHLVLVILCGCLVCRGHTRQYQLSHKHSCFSWWWAHSHLKHVEIDKYAKNKLCIE